MKLNVKLALLAIPFIALAGCFSGGGSSSDSFSLTMDTDKAIAIAANSPDFQTSDVLLINQISTSAATLIQGELSTTDPSDISVASEGNALYRMNRSTDSVTRYNMATDGSFNLAWEYSVSDNGSANPYTLVQASDDKAFVLRYDSTEIWVVDPSASMQDEFKLDAIDLEAFNPTDGSAPKMTAALIHDDVLYVLLERLTDNFSPEENSFLVAYDVNTLKEVTLGGAAKGKGLDLGVRNATGMSLVGNKLYIVGRGDTGSGGEGEGEGGIVQVSLDDPASANADLLIDDGEAGNRPWGQMLSLSIVDDQNGYFVGSEGWQDDRLYHFNPGVGEDSIQALSGTGGGGLGGLLHVTNTQNWSAPDLLFVGRSAVEDGRSAGVLVIDVTTSPQSVESVIETDFNPSALTLIQH